MGAGVLVVLVDACRISLTEHVGAPQQQPEVPPTLGSMLKPFSTLSDPGVTRGSSGLFVHSVPIQQRYYCRFCSVSLPFGVLTR
jgi:hypothetical protein